MDKLEASNSSQADLMDNGMTICNAIYAIYVMPLCHTNKLF